jgi:hypothetical protein
MKGFVVLLALLAAGKVAYQEYLARTATSEIIIAAYRDRAISACQRESRSHDHLEANVWSRPKSVRLVIGKSDLDVHLWQVDHAHWNARFKNPYLFVRAGEGTNRVTCEFDIVHGATSIGRM